MVISYFHPQETSQDQEMVGWFFWQHRVVIQGLVNVLIEHHPNYWGYNLQQILVLVMSKIPKFCAFWRSTPLPMHGSRLLPIVSGGMVAAVVEGQELSVPPGPLFVGDPDEAVAATWISAPQKRCPELGQNVGKVEGGFLNMRVCQEWCISGKNRSITG